MAVLALPLNLSVFTPIRRLSKEMLEQDMSYIVVYQRADGSSGLEECVDLDLAIVTAERLRNVDAVERPRIFETEEIHYDFKPYYRVEVMPGGEAAAAVVTNEVTPVAASGDFDDITNESTEPAAPVADMGVPAVDEVDTDASEMDIPANTDTSSEESAFTHDVFNTEVADVEELTPPEVPNTSNNGLFGVPDAPEVPDVSEVAEEAAASVEAEASAPRRGLFGR